MELLVNYFNQGLMAFITAIGIANPPFKRPQLETAQLICDAFKLKSSEKRLIKSIYKATGIEYRYSVLSDYCKNSEEFEFFPSDPTSSFPTTSERMKLYKNNALNLALQAIDNCLANHSSSIKNNITHVITVSCTGMYAPGLDIEIIQHLNLLSSVKRTCVNFMGCYGAFNGLKLAEAICHSEPNATVLLVSVELCTIHFQQNMNLDNVVSNSIFADGAAAVLIQSKSFQNKKCFKLNNFYCDLLPQSNDAMTWHIGNNGFDIVLSSYVSEMIQSGIYQFSERLLSQNKIDIADIDFFGIHPGGKKILQACEKALHISEKDNRFSYQILKNYGNMSSATILFVLKEIWKEVTTNDHDKTIFSCAFGPGLTLESMLLSIHYEN